MQIDKIITDYVSAKDTDYAIMIDGEWGAGKSWYWENVLTEQIKRLPTRDNTEEKPSMYKVAKISLFGIISDAINFNLTSYIPLLIRVSERSLIF